ncbi:MAG: isoprenylcysteine carboxylmethyltransferase family protein [Promethearchaeota archaeon]
MNGDFLFFIIFLITFVGIFVIRGYYGWKSPDRKKSLRELTRSSTKHEGRVTFTLLVFLGIIWLVALVLYIFFPYLFPWMVLPIPDWFRWLGVIIAFISLFLLWWAHATLGKAFSKILTIQDQHTLVSNGPYQRVRHPMYTAFIILFLSWFLMTAHILFFFLWFTFLVYIVLRMPQEEAMLLEKFGETYREYILRTGRLFPPLRKQNKEDKINQG